MTHRTQLRQQLRDDLAEVNSALWSTGFLRNPPVPEESEAVLVAHELRSFTSVFPRCLGMLIGQTDDDAARAVLIENLWEEHGSGDLRHSHRAIFDRFFKSLTDRVGPRVEVPSTPLGSTVLASDALLQTSANGFLRGLGALAAGVEAGTSAQFRVVQDYFVGLPCGDELDIDFFALHVASDDEHTDAMITILEKYVTDDETYAQALDGARLAVGADLRFWDGLGVALSGRLTAAG